MAPLLPPAPPPPPVVPAGFVPAGFVPAGSVRPGLVPAVSSASPEWPPRIAHRDASPRGEVKRWLAVLAIGLVVLSAVAVTQLPHAAPAPLADLGATVSCSLDAPWACHRVTVPARRGAGADPAAQVDVLFAIHPATHPRGGSRRVLVIVDGGPGASGIRDADTTARAFGPRVTDAMDIVAFDARGTGKTDHHACPNAEQVYPDASSDATSARQFAAACVLESGVAPEELERFGSREIAEDIDAIRGTVGAERITLYGASYGTVIAQAYAAAHPERLDGLVLDAPLDRSLRAADFWVRAGKGFGEVLDETLAACADDDDCRAVLPDARKELDDIYQLIGANGELDGTVVDGDGARHEYGLYRADLDRAINAAMYGPGGRMVLLRAIAQARRGNRGGLLRLVSEMGGGGSSFAYYATWCADVRASPTERVDDFAGLSAFVADAGVHAPGRDVAMALAPCLYWPGQPSSWAAPPESTSVPMLVLTATADPITPRSMAEAIVARHPEARLVETTGGAHGSIGELCADDRLADFIVEGRLPIGPKSTCTADVVEPFLPLATSPASNGSDAGLGLYWELFGTPELLLWDGSHALDIGCGDEGSAHLGPVDDQSHAQVTFRGCQWATNARFDGTGWLDPSTGEVDLQLTSANGELHVTAERGRVQVTGTWKGSIVDARW